ncbi:MAG: membrane dipeptidase [Solobacterium sp.]|nr:membrane dipeptidase [Solobacterium sp.]
MKIFDLHADLAEAIRPAYKDGKRSVLRNDWHGRFKKGEIGWTSAASFFAGRESWEEMQETVRMVKEDILSSGYELILTKEDLKENPTETMFLMTVEGMCGIHDDPEGKIQWLYDQGNRIGSLEWNDQNDLATGNSGDPARGLTELGRRAVRKMNELHMIVDVSHANEKTF